MRFQPKARIHESVLAMHDKFDVDTERIGFIMRKAGAGFLSLLNFKIWFEESQAPDFTDKGEAVGGWHTAGQNGVHVVCGQLTDMPYLGSPGSYNSFENVILHELGHYFHFSALGLKKFLRLPEPNREAVAQHFSDLTMPSAGVLVDYEFKPRFVGRVGTGCEIEPGDLPPEIPAANKRI